MVYTIIRKRHVFHALANLPSDVQGISKCLSSRKIAVTGNQTVNHVQSPKTPSPTAELKTFTEITPPPPPPAGKTFSETEEEDVTNIESKSDVEESMEGSHPAQPAEPGTLKASLLETPAIATMTEKESAHPLTAPLCDFSPMNENFVSTTANEVESVELSKLSFEETKEIETPPPLKRTVAQVRFLIFFS